MSVIAIDPGNVESALVLWDGRRILGRVKEPNPEILKRLTFITPELRTVPLVIEQVTSYGMPVGREVFDTVFWSGRFTQAYGISSTHLIPRMDVKMHLCHSSRAKDSNIRQALIDRLGPIGTKKQPGPLYGVSGDIWAALALAVTAWDRGIGRQSKEAA